MLRKRWVEVWLFAILGISNSWSYVYFDDFSSSNSSWQYKFLYSLQAGIHNESHSMTIGPSGGLLQFGGDGLSTAYYAELFGFYARYTNVRFSATAETPFGFEVTRTLLSLDSDEGLHQESGRKKAAFDIGFIQYDPAVITISNRYVNSLFFSEVYHPKLAGEADTQPRSLWSLNESGSPSNVIGFASVMRPDGVAASDLRGIMNWCYDDRWGMNTLEPSGGTLNNYSNNNNTIKIRVTIDGLYASLYVNPNPLGLSSQQNWDGSSASYLNTFYFVTKVPVVFSNELMAMIGLANNRVDAECLLLNVDNFTIRTIAASNVAEISPVFTKAGSTNQLSFFLKPWFSASTEAGVQEILIRLPQGYTHTNWAAFTNHVGVFWMNTNGTVVRTFGRVYTDANPSSGIVALSIKEGGRLLKIRFNAASSPDIFHPTNFSGSLSSTHQHMIVVVVSNFFTSAVGDVVGKTFEVYVNNEKYPDTTWGMVATTGPAKAYAGNVVNVGGTFLDNNTLTFRTANDPVGVASIRPSFTYEGESKTWFVDIAAKNTNETVDNNADISHVDIFLPPGFLVEPSSLQSSVCSSILYDPILRKVSLLYSNENKVLAAGSGNDTVSFLNLSTTNLDIPFPGTNELSNRVVLVSYSSLPGTKPVTNGISISYPNQHFLVRKKPPKAEAYQTPREVKNILTSQEYSFVVKNRAENVGNNIRRLLIRVDKRITNVTSVIPGRAANVTVRRNITNANITNSENYLWILLDYAAQNTNIQPYHTETVKFTGYDDVRSLTNVVIWATNIAYVDNGNGDGWVFVKEDTANGWSYFFYTPSAELKASLLQPLNEDGVVDSFYNHHHYVDKNEPLYIRLNLRNTGELDNTIFRVRITFPYGITNVMYPFSMMVGSNQISLYQTNAGSNWVMEIAYTNIIALWSGSNDMVSCYLMDNISTPTNALIRIEARNTTNYVFAENDGADNTELRFIYPRPRASGAVMVPGGFIDAATNRADITYIISNYGSVENFIKRAYILVPTNYITNVTGVSSALGGVFGGFEPHSPGYYRLVIDYGTQFFGGRGDTIAFTVWDRVETEVEFLLLASVSNQRMWSNSISPLPDGTQQVVITPPPTFYEYAVLPSVLYRSYDGRTNTNAVRLSVKNMGWGSNRLERLRIFLPPALSNQIFMVTNALLGRTLSGAAISFTTLGGTNIVEVNYKLSNTNVPPGGTDDFYLLTAVWTNILATNWLIVHAANNSTNTNGTPKWTNYYTSSSLLSKTNVITLVDPVRFFVLPGEVSSPASSALYSNRIENGLENGGRLVSAVEIGYPGDFFTNLQVISTIGNATVTGTRVRIEYPFGLMPNNGEWVVLRGYDTWETGNTNFLVTVRAWYTNNGSFTNMAVVRHGYTNRVAFIHPPAHMWASSSPNVVGQDFVSNLYLFEVTNVGGEGNTIRWVRIVLPSFITNASGFASQHGATIASSNGAIWVFYSSPLPVGGYDKLSFWGWDTIDVGQETNIVWVVYADNTSTYTTPAPAGLYPSRSLALSIVQPTYNASAYLELTNAISLARTNALYTTETNNGLRFYLYNNSGTGNMIRRVRIPVPYAGSLLVTNALTFTNLRTGVTRAFSNGAMWFDYSGAPLHPTEGDEIWVQLHDKIFYSNTNITWQIEAAYNTTDDKFKVVSLQPGRSLTVFYVAPPPSVNVSLLHGIIYFDRKYFSLNMRISNAGKSTSAVDQVMITLPSEFRNGFSIAKVSNTVATFTNYDVSGGVLVLRYGNPLGSGQTDTVTLWLSNTMVSPGVRSFLVDVQSFVTNAVAMGDSNLIVSSLPTYAVYVNDVITNAILDTTTHSNRVVVQLINNVSADMPVERVRISLPTQFTNRLKTISRKVSGSFVTGHPTNIVVDYKNSSNLLAAGEYDVLQNDVLDGFSVGYATNKVEVWVEDPWGYLPLPLEVGATNEVRFVMPLPQGTQWLSVGSIYIDTMVSNLTLYVSNTARTANSISNVEIALPDGLVDIRNVVSGRGNASYDGQRHAILVSYSLGLMSNSVDGISFAFSNTYRAPTNLRFTVHASHLPDHRGVVSSIQGETYSILPVNYPPVAVEGYFVGDNSLYLVENEGILTYRLVNRTFKSEVRQVLLTFEANTVALFSNMFITNTRASVTRLATNSNQFLLEYFAGQGIGSSQNEDIKIHFFYTLTNTTMIPVRSVADIVSVGSGGTNVSDYETFSLDQHKRKMFITNSMWGIVRGSVFPSTKLVYVKMYHPDGSIALDDRGNPLSQTVQIGTGNYKLARVIGGSYILEFTAPYYRTMRIPIEVPADKTIVLPMIAMRNAPLLAGEDEMQPVECYEDTNTIIIFPGGSVEKEFSVDITRVPLTPEQKRNLAENSKIRPPSSTANMYGYRFSLNTRDDKPMAGAIIKRDAILYLAYDASDIVSRGWSESDLAIYYWDDNGLNPRWVRVGGEVDTTRKRLVAKVSYVHSFYGVFSKAGEDRPGVITGVTLRPKVFTPNRSGDGYYCSVRVTIEFRAPVERYEVRIFDLKGNLIRRFVREDGPYTQGEVAWDGKDMEGYDVKNGVYVYKIYARGETYSGTLVIAR